MTWLDPEEKMQNVIELMEHIEGDRLSSLADDLVHKIFSSISIKEVIQTSVLSSRWRYIWTSMPVLNFKNLNHFPHVSKFISNVLSHRNNQMQVSSVSLVLGRTVMDDESVKTILNCASTHNVQQLTITRTPDKIYERTSLYGLSFIATPTLNLPALTTLRLHHITLSHVETSTGKCVSLLSLCDNLKNLFLRRCTLKGTKVLNICHHRLSNLTLEYIHLSNYLNETVNVVAPQLKNLTVIWCEGKHCISAPGLTSLVIEESRYNYWPYSGSGFPSLEKADLYKYLPARTDPEKVFCLLPQLHSAKLIILSLAIFQHLSAYEKVFLRQACVFANAQIIKFTTKSPVKVYLEVRAQEKGSEIEDSETSPSALFPMISHQEIEAMANMASAQLFVESLGMLLNKCKANTITNTSNARMDEHGKLQVEKHWALTLLLNLEEMMALIRQSKFVALKICLIMAQCTTRCIAWLQEIRWLFQRIGESMIQLSESKRAVMQPNFSSLCEDAAIITSNILGWMQTVKETQKTNAPYFFYGFLFFSLLNSR